MDSEDYKDIEDFSEGLAATRHNNGVCGYINKKGYETLLYEYINVGLLIILLIDIHIVPSFKLL